MKTIILKDDRWQKVKSGEMKTWLTINDDYAKSIQIGELVSIMNDATSELCYARVNGYLVYGSFEELYSKSNKDELGYDKKDSGNIKLIKSQMFAQCDPEAEKEFGVRGIKLEYLPDFKDPQHMTEREAQAYLQGMVKGVQKARRQFYRSIEKAETFTSGLAKLIESNAEIYFAGMDGEIENDMLKWTISEHIKHCQMLLDNIQQYEDKCKFPILHKYPNHRQTQPTTKTTKPKK